MATLTFKNTSASPLEVADLGIYLESNEDLDLLLNFRDEDIIESTNIQAAMSAGGEVTLNGATVLTYQDLIDYLTKLSHYDTIDFAYISSEDSSTDVTGAELEQLTDGSDSSLHIHDTRYYTKTNLQTAGQSAVNWENITNVPQFGDLHWQDPADRTDSSYGSGVVLPVSGNEINDARMVKDDGDGKPAQYVCVATSGTWDQQWKKIADVDWGTAAYIGVTPVGNLTADDVQEALQELQGDIDTLDSTISTINLDYAYNNGSVVTVDNTIVDWRLTDSKDFKITSDLGATNILKVSAAAAGDSVTINADTTINGGSFNVSADEPSKISVSGSSLTLETQTSGNVVIGSAGLITFNDQYTTSPIQFSETGETALDASFDANSILGALNELKTGQAAMDTLDEAYDGPTGSGSGRVITADSGSVKIDATSGSYAPIELTPQATAPSAGLAGGQLSVLGGELYIYDDTRTKWLSVQEKHYTWSDNVIKGKYMSIGNSFGTNVGYKIPVNASIVKVVAYAGGGDQTRALQIRKNGSPTSLKSFSLASGSYTSIDDDISLTAGDILQIYVSGATGLPTKELVVDVYLRWRK